MSYETTPSDMMITKGEHRGRILIAEDSPTQAEEIRFLLEESGYSVLLARDGQEALDLATAEHADLLISDIVMPKIDGYELCRRIKTGGKVALPVMLVTNLSSPGDVLKGLNAGADNFITKPYNARYLIDQVEYLLTNRRLRDMRKLEVGVEIELHGQRHFITANRQQILDLLLSTYSEAVHLNDELAERERNLRQSVKALDTLFRISQALNECRTRAEVLQRTLIETAPLAGIEGGWAYTFGADSQPQLSARFGLPDWVEEEVLCGGACRCMDLAREPKRGNAATLMPCSRLPGENGTPQRSHAVIPIVAEERCLGMINLLCSDETPIPFEQLNILTTVGNQVGAAIQRAEMLESLEARVAERTAALHERERRQKSLAVFGREALSNRAIDTLKAKACELVAEVLGAAAVGIFERTGDDECLLLSSAWNWDDAAVGRTTLPEDRRSLAHRAFQERRSLSVDDWAKEKTFLRPPLAEARGYAASIAAIIQGPERPSGVMVVHFLEADSHSDDDPNFLQNVANTLGTVFEQDAARRSLEESELRFRRIAESNLIGVFFARQDGSISYANSVFLTMLGYEQDDLGSDKLAYAAIRSPEGCAHDRKRLRAIREEGPQSPWECEFLRRDGTPLPALMNLAFLSEETNECIGIVLDTTALKQAEAQLRQMQRMEAIANLTGGVAHDFNNLLTVVVGNTDLIEEEGALPEELRSCTEAILRAAQAGSDLTRQLLAFARRQTLEPEAVETGRLVRGVEKLLDRLLGETITVRVEAEGSVWPIFADASQIDSALLNLAINARDAMPRGGKLTISAANRDVSNATDVDGSAVTPGAYVMLEVRDTGEGIPPDILQRVFEPFFTTKGPGQGSGLGLAMVYGFVKQSGGYVSVDSTLGEGTVFRLFLPRYDGGDNAAPKPRQEKTATTRGSGQHILVVEDNPAIRTVVVRHLDALGYSHEEVESGARALERLERDASAFDLVFSDVMMPEGVTGYDLADRVRARWPGLPVLLTSGSPMTQYQEQTAADAGIEILRKPYRRQQLAEKLDDLLVKKSGK